MAWYRSLVGVPVRLAVLVSLAVLSLSNCPGVLGHLAADAAIGRRGPADTIETAYERATHLLFCREYEPARRGFRDLIESHPDSPFAGPARLKIAESYFLEGDLHRAAADYRGYIDAYPDSPLAADARVRLAQCLADGAGALASPAVEPAGVAPRVAAIVPVLPGRELADVDGAIARIAENGFTAVILRVFQDRDQPLHGAIGVPENSVGVYFRSSMAPTVVDLLPVAAQACRRHGVKLLAWMNTREADYGVPADSPLRATRYDPSTGGIVPAPGLDLFHPETERRLTTMFAELASYDLDGILLYDDLIVMPDEAVSPSAAAAYAARFGRALDRAEALAGYDPLSDAAAWAESAKPAFRDLAVLRAERTASLQAHLAAAVKQVRPSLRFGVSFHHVSLDGTPYAFARVGQDPALAAGERFDLIAVTVYQRQVEADLGLSASEAADTILEVVQRAIDAAGREDRVLAKLQIVDWERSAWVEPDEVDSLLADLAAESNAGVALFPYRDDYPFEQLDAQLAEIAGAQTMAGKENHATIED